MLHNATLIYLKSSFLYRALKSLRLFCTRLKYPVLIGYGGRGCETDFKHAFKSKKSLFALFFKSFKTMVLMPKILKNFDFFQF